MQYRALAAVLMICPGLAFGAAYKCVKAGKVRYQDTPCAAGASGGEVNLPPGTEPSPAAEADATSELESTKAWLKNSQDDREKASLDRQIHNAEVDRDHLQVEMDGELAKLQVKKLYAKNNLAGATWEQSISTEMSAVTQKYDAKMRAAEIHIADLKAQRAKYSP